jgi:hypothetical protein
MSGMYRARGPSGRDSRQQPDQRENIFEQLIRTAGTQPDVPDQQRRRIVAGRDPRAGGKRCTAARWRGTRQSPRSGGLTMTPNRIVCERCGGVFDCSPSNEGECWCAKESFRVPMPAPPESGGVRGCLCPSCLRLAALTLVGARTGSAIPLDLGRPDQHTAVLIDRLGRSITGSSRDVSRDDF